MEPRVLFYTVKQAAWFLKVSESAVYEAIRRGQLPAVAIGDRYRIPAIPLHAMAAGRPQATWGEE
jgi:excisionase family DNA binding protein